MDPTKFGILACMLVVLGVPFLFRPESQTSGDADRRVIIITPHNEQIRTEFERGFAHWHEREFGETADVVWVTPGGTSEIRRQLQSIYTKALQDGQILPNGELAEGVTPMPQDIIFGGGTYEHGEVKKGVKGTVPERSASLIALAERAFMDVLPSMDPEGTERLLVWLKDQPYELPEGMTVEAFIAASSSLKFNRDIEIFDGPGGIEQAIAWNEARDEEIAELAKTIDADWMTVESLNDMSRWVTAMPTNIDGLASTPLDLLRDGLGGMPSGVSLSIGGGSIGISLPMSVPFTYYSASELASIFGENRIGPEGNELYDPERFWVGTATSGFGIVFNRDILVGELGLQEPRMWQDFSSPELRGWVALADPRQSGSVATLYDSILNNLGWEDGWRQLREMCANARYFSNSSPKVPLDVSQGQAAIGVAIDFYGRYQAQAVMREGETPETSRVGYVDPAGQVFIDPDPISILRGGPDPEMANRFVAFVLSDEGQALWQFAAKGESDNGAGGSLADAPSTWGPERFELRRMPVRRDFIAEHFEQLTDKVNPFAIAAETKSRGWRSSVGPMMACFGINTHRELIRAWEALNGARADPSFPAGTLEEMERLFYAMPTHVFPDGTELEFSPENYGAVRNEWRNPTERRKALVAYTRFFKSNYQRVVDLAQNPVAGEAG